MRVLYITRGKFKEKKKKETRKTPHTKSQTSGATNARGSRGAEVPSGGPRVRGAAWSWQCVLGALTHSPSHPSPAGSRI